MIAWDQVAKRLKFPTEAAMWVNLYTTRQFSLPQLSQKFGVSKQAIRTALARCKVRLRERGGRRRNHPHFTEDQVSRIRQEGMKAAAARLGMTYYEIRKRIHQAEDFFAGRRGGTPL
jgi:hypothetical protein